MVSRPSRPIIGCQIHTNFELNSQLRQDLAKYTVHEGSKISGSLLGSAVVRANVSVKN